MKCESCGKPITGHNYYGSPENPCVCGRIFCQICILDHAPMQDKQEALK